MKVLVCCLADQDPSISEAEMLDWPPKRVEGMYYRLRVPSSKKPQLIPVAYVYKIEARKYLEKAITNLKKSREDFRRYEYNIYRQSNDWRI